MNRKGTTIIEILVSLALISIVMIFLFNLLADLKREDAMSSSKSADSLNRTSIIHLVQNDFITKKLNKVTYTSSNNSVSFTFYYDDTTSKVFKVGTNYVSYGDEIWNLNENNSYDLDNITYCFNGEKVNNPNLPDLSHYIYLNISIPEKVDAAVKRKYDIVLTYMGNVLYDKTSFPCKIEYNSKPRTCVTIGSNESTEHGCKP